MYAIFQGDFLSKRIFNCRAVSSIKTKSHFVLILPSFKTGLSSFLLICVIE